MHQYKLTDRLKEWTSWAGVAIAMIGGGLPHLVGVNVWAAALATLLPALGAAMVFIPQTPSMQGGESLVLTLLRVLAADVPPAYAAAMAPILAALSAKVTLTAAQDPPPVVTAPAPVSAVTGPIATVLGMILALTLGSLAACSTTQDVATAETGLTAAENLAVAYAALPACTGANGPICSTPEVLASIKAADTVAYNAVKAAEGGTGSQAAAAAIAALLALIPAGTAPAAPAAT